MDEINLGDVTLTKYGMLYIEDYELAVMADFHIGYEEVMANHGVFLPKIQKQYILSLLDDVYTKYEPKTLLINGDFKHEFSKNMPQEWDELDEVIDFIADRSNIIIVRGNHDNYLRLVLRKHGLDIMYSYSIGNYFFVHGHRDVKIKGITVIGHEHPSVTLRDEIFATAKIPCFLYSKDIIVLPAVSIYATGTDITKNDFISPILRENRRDFEIFGIEDGISVIPMGNISSFPL